MYPEGDLFDLWHVAWFTENEGIKKIMQAFSWHPHLIVYCPCCRETDATLLYRLRARRIWNDMWRAIPDFLCPSRSKRWVSSPSPHPHRLVESEITCDSTLMLSASADEELGNRSYRSHRAYYFPDCHSIGYLDLRNAALPFGAKLYQLV